MTSNPFDQACRYLAKLDPLGLLCWVLKLLPAQVRFRGWTDARRVRFPGEPDRTCDTVAFLEHVDAGQQPWAVPVEFQVEPDPDMFGRLLGYLGGLWLEERPSDNRGDRFHVGAVVVNLTDNGNSSREMSWPGAGLLTHLGVKERNLPAADARTTSTSSRRSRACRRRPSSAITRRAGISKPPSKKCVATSVWRRRGGGQRRRCCARRRACSGCTAWWRCCTPRCRSRSGAAGWRGRGKRR